MSNQLLDKIAHVRNTVVSVCLTAFLFPAVGVLFTLIWLHVREPAHAVAISQIEAMRLIEEDAQTERARMAARVELMTVELARIRVILDERLPPR